MNVKEELRRVAGSARQCVLVRTGPDKRPVTLQFDLPADGKLLVRAGNTVEAARAGHGGNVNAALALDGEVFESLTIERRDYRLHEASVQASKAARLSVTLVADDDRKREICLDGYLLTSDVWTE